MAKEILNIDKSEILRLEQEEHKRYHRRLAYVLIVILLMLFAGATFYYLVEKWTYLDAVYFSASTITTVGYGDITPKTFAGKLFTIFYLFAGVAIALYGLSIIAAHFVEAREEFWLERLGKIRIRQHTETFWGKLKKLFLGYDSNKLVRNSRFISRKK